jgi:hypothetical protein
VKLTLSFDDASVLDRVFSVRDGPGLYRFEVYQNGGKLGIFISTLGQSVGYAVTTDTFVFEDDTDYVVEFIQDGTGIDITIDGASVDILIVVAVDDSGWWDSALTPTKANIGAFHDLTGYHAGRLYNVSFTTLDDTILASYGIHDGGLNIENSVGVDSTLVVTDADAFWALKIPALLDGTADAQGNPISNPAGYVHNISECSVIQTDFGIVDSIKISRAGFFTDSVAEYLGIDINGYPKYRWEYTPGVQAIYIVYNKDLFYNEESYGDQWIATDDVIGGETYSDVAATKAVTTHFPFVGTWDAVAWSEAFSVAYDSFWVESGEFDKKTYADLLAHYNVNGDKNLWLKLDKDGFVEVDDSVQYPLDKVFTVTEATRNLKYFGTGGNVLYDGGGEVVIDVDGFVVYTA